MAATFTDLIRADLQDYCPASNLAFNEKVKALQREDRTVYHFGFGQAPFPVLPCMVEALREYAGEKAYLPVAGIPELREAVVDFHQQYDRLTHLSPDNVIIGPGTKELFFLMMNVFQGDVLVLSPSWTTYRPQAVLAHHQPIVVPTHARDEWRLTPAALEQAIVENGLSGNKVLILCNPDNPTGTSYGSEHFKELSETLRKHSVIVISDEIYARLHYTASHDSLARYYPEGTILSSGMSKWASAGGWRLGYHVYPAELSALRDAVCSAASHTYSCAAAPMQYAVAKGLRNKEAVADYIAHTTRIMAAVSQYCLRMLQSIGVEVVPAKASYYLLPDFEMLRPAMQRRGITTGQQMCDTMLDEANVALMAGGPAFLRPVEEFTVRLCYVCFDGAHSLRISQELGLDKPLDDDFVKDHVTNVYDGVQALKNWCVKQLESTE